MAKKQTPIIEFKTLGELATSLSSAIERGKGISFHNKGGFYIGDKEAGLVYEMAFTREGAAFIHKTRQGTAFIHRTFQFVNPFFRASKLSICYPDFRENNPEEADKDVIALGSDGKI